MRLASAADFEGGGLYTQYHRYPFFAERAAELSRRFQNGKILIAGCGWGYLVEDALAAGFDAWGCDASAYAVAKSQEVLAAPARSRIIQADITVRSQLTTLRSTAGLTGAQRFRAVVTEDVLPVLTDAEITAALIELRRIAIAGAVLHIVTPGDPADPAKFAPLNWKPIETWRALCAPDLVLDAETGTVG